MFAISSSSFKSKPTLTLSTSIVSLIKQSQYFASFADFKAIAKKFFQSFFELPALPSTTLAPTDVALLIN